MRSHEIALNFLIAVFGGLITTVMVLAYQRVHGKGQPIGSADRIAPYLVGILVVALVAGALMLPNVSLFTDAVSGTSSPVATEGSQAAIPSTASAHTTPTLTMTPTSAPTPAVAARHWVHNPQLGAPINALPGLEDAGTAYSKGGDKSVTLVNVSLGENDILVMSGDRATFPNPELGSIGLATDCYMVVARGPMVWTPNPVDGQYSSIRLAPGSWAGWHIDHVDPDASVNRWADEWVSGMVNGADPGNPCRVASCCWGRRRN